MNVGIHKFSRDTVYDFEKIYREILTFNNIPNIYLHISQPDFWEKLKETDLFISRWIDISNHDQLGHTLLPIIESAQITKCFPTYHNYWSYDDKIRQYYLLRQHGFPVIETYVFWNKSNALEWIDTASLPTVFKLKGGASSNNVVLIKSRDQGKRFIKKMFGSGVKSGKLPTRGHVKFADFDLQKIVRHWAGNLLKTINGIDVNDRWQLHKNYALFQRFLPGNTFDTRVVVNGNRIQAFRRFNRENDFRASGSGKIDLNPEAVDTRCLQIALNVSKKLNYQTMGYDFLYDEENNPLISEMSYTYGTKTLPRCPGYWDENLSFHEGNYWPQYFQLMHLLDRPDLEQPNIIIEEENVSQRFQRVMS